MVSGTTLQTNMAATLTDTLTVIVEVKYINSKNVVIHCENCKVETAQQLSKKICHMTGIYEASKKLFKVITNTGSPDVLLVKLY